jgi:hypothetical protein
MNLNQSVAEKIEPMTYGCRGELINDFDKQECEVLIKCGNFTNKK